MEIPNPQGPIFTQTREGEVGGRAKGGCHAMLDVWTVLPSRFLCGTRHNLNPQNSTVLLGGIFLPLAPQELFQPQDFLRTGRRDPPGTINPY